MPTNLFSLFASGRKIEIPTFYSLVLNNQTCPVDIYFKTKKMPRKGNTKSTTQTSTPQTAETAPSAQTPPPNVSGKKKQITEPKEKTPTMKGPTIVHRVAYFGVPLHNLFEAPVKPVMKPGMDQELYNRQMKNYQEKLEKYQSRIEPTQPIKTDGISEEEYQKAMQIYQEQLKRYNEVYPVLKKRQMLRDGFQKDNRIVVVAYNYNRETKELKYGATIYREDDPKSDETTKHESRPFSREGHRARAEKRLERHPIIINGFEDKGMMEEFDYELRKCIRKNGVCSK